MKFCGLSVLSASCDGGFNGQRGELRVTCVVDPFQGDSPVIPPEGTPVYFNFGAQRFYGLMQSWARKLSIQGEIYDFVCIDPSEILEAAVVLTESYSGASPLANVINAYGWHENAFGFGFADSNSSGMPWTKIRAAINYLCNTSFVSAYGAPINYRGILYAVDLSEIPIGVAGYRVPVGNSTLLQVIDTVCKDFQLDYFFEFSGLAVKVRTFSRATETSLGGTAAALEAATYAGTVSSYTIGAEARNETNGVVLVGAPVSGIFESTEIRSYWGDDLAGIPIVGNVRPHPDFDPLIFGLCEFMWLPCAEIADSTGAIYYKSNTIEMRCALAGQDLWADYVKKYYTGVGNIGEIIGAVYKIPVAQAKVKGDLIDDEPAKVVQALNTDVQIRTSIIYNWVRKYAEEFFGKRFLVRVPGVQVKAPEAGLEPMFSHEPDSAGWLEGGPPALGVLDQDKFSTQDGRTLPYAIIPNAPLIDPNELDPDRMAVSGGVLFTHCDISEKIIIPRGPVTIVDEFGLLSTLILPIGAYVKVDLTAPMFYRKPIDGGDATRIINNLAPQAGAGGVAAQIHRNQAGGTFGQLSMFPNPVYPAAVGVPLRSNVTTYGPWAASGAFGKVDFIQDTSLSPWDYGGQTGMDLAANARVNAAASYQTRSEFAEATLAGIPAISIGDILASGGPHLTSMGINYSTGGFTTHYRFAAFTNRSRGTWARQLSEKLRKMATTGNDARRKLNREAGKAVAINNGLRSVKANRNFRKNIPKWAKGESPNDVIIARNFVDGDDLRTLVSVTTQEEAMAIANPDSDADHQATSLMSLSGLLRPYQVGGSNTSMPVANLVDASATIGPQTSAAFFPFTPPHDVEAMAWDTTYSGTNARERNPGPDGVRPIALRAPLWLNGFGAGQDCLNIDDGGGRRADLAKAGPIDPLWDYKRQVWTVHDLFRGTVPSGARHNNTGIMCIAGYYDWQVPVYNPGPMSVPSGGYVTAGYIPNENRFVILGGYSNSTGQVSVPGYSPRLTGSIEDICITAKTTGIPDDVWGGTGVINVVTQVGLIIRVRKPDGTLECITRGMNDCGDICGPEWWCIDGNVVEIIPTGPPAPPPVPPPPPENEVWYCMASGVTNQCQIWGAPPIAPPTKPGYTVTGPFSTLGDCSIECGPSVSPPPPPP